MKKKIISSLIFALALPAFAQQKPDEPPPRWLQGRSEADAKSTLHPFAPKLTGTEISELKMSKLKQKKMIFGYRVKKNSLKNLRKTNLN